MNLYFPSKMKVLSILALMSWLLMAGLLTAGYAEEGSTTQKRMRAEVVKDKDEPAKPAKGHPNWEDYQILTPGLWKELGQALYEADFPDPSQPDGPGGPTQTWECKAKLPPNQDQCTAMTNNRKGCNNGGGSTICKSNPCRCDPFP